jgi:hypothetical protein
VSIAESMVSATDVRCPECTTVFANPAAGPSGYSEAVGAAGMSIGYSLDLGRIFNRGWSGFTQGLGMLVGFTVVGLLLSIPVAGIIFALNLIPIIGSLLGSVVSAAVLAPLWYGLVVVALLQLRGRPWTFGEFFGGFRFWAPLFVYTLIVSVFSWVCTLPASICLFLAGSGAQLNALLQGQPPPPLNPILNLIGQVLNFGGLVIIIIVSVRYLALCPYMIIDRNYGALDAIKANAALTQGHFFGWLGVLLLFGLIGGAGLLACCVGFIFTVPLCYCLITSAYLEATGASP